MKGIFFCIFESLILEFSVNFMRFGVKSGWNGFIYEKQDDSGKLLDIVRRYRPYIAFAYLIINLLCRDWQTFTIRRTHACCGSYHTSCQLFLRKLD